MMLEARPRIVHYYGCVRCQCNHYEMGGPLNVTTPRLTSLWRNQPTTRRTMVPALSAGSQFREDDIRTHGVMWLDRKPAISAYFRTHRTCAEATNMDPYCESVLDALRAGEII